MTNDCRPQLHIGFCTTGGDAESETDNVMPLPKSSVLTSGRLQTDDITSDRRPEGQANAELLIDADSAVVA